MAVKKKAKRKVKTVSKKQWPKHRPKALYAYVSRKAHKAAHASGNASAFVESLILGSISKRKPSKRVHASR